MKLKIWASIAFMSLLIFILSGCGLKMPKDSGTSPSPSGDSDASASGTAETDSAGGKTLTGVVTAVDGKTITLELAEPYDPSSGSSSSTGNTASPSESPEDENTGESQTKTSSSDLVANGSSLFSLTGGTQAVTASDSTAVILESQGYAAGSLSDVAEGDFLAVAVNGGSVIAIIDGGSSNHNSGSSGASSGDSAAGSTDSGSSDSSGSSSGSSGTGMDPVAPSAKPQSGSHSGNDLSADNTYDNVPVDSSASSAGSSGSSGSADQGSDSDSASSSSQNGSDSDSDSSGSYTVTLDKLKVRSGPGTSYSILGTLAKGTKITGEMAANDWFKLTYNGKTAYCSSVYLKSSSSSGTTATGKTASGVTDSGKSATYKVTVDDLKVRSKPGASEASLGTLAKGTKVTGTVTNGWLKFTYEGKTAYCSAKYLASA